MAEAEAGSSTMQGQPVSAVTQPPREARVKARLGRLEAAVAKAERRSSPRLDELREALAITQAEAALEQRKRRAREAREARRTGR